MKHDAEISNSLDTRLMDIAIAKKLVTRAKSSIERRYLEQCAITTIYASMEGGVKDLVRIYLREIDASKCAFSALKPCFMVLALSSTCKLEQEVKDFSKQVKVVSDIVNAVQSKPKLPNDIDTESNLTPKVLEKIRTSLDLPPIIPAPSDESDLNILLRFRNNIAHGDRNMPVGTQRIDQLSAVVIKILCQVALAVSDAIRNRAWENAA